MNTIDIKGKELHFVKRVLNRQQYNDHFTIDTFNNERGDLQWGKDFIANLEKKDFYVLIMDLCMLLT